MCRWLTYTGAPVLPEDLILRPTNSLVVQSRHSRLGMEPVNGDGFGVGWYDGRERPGIFRSTEPAWNDPNLRELAEHAWTGNLFAHIRASTGSPVQLTNCHPFRHGRWLWMHNGGLAEFDRYRRELLLAVDPVLFNGIQGSTDSEVLFHLALSLGLQDDPHAGMARAVGLVEVVAQRHGVAHPVQMTVATTDGATTWTFRYSSEGRSRTLFHNEDMATLRDQYPDSDVLQRMSEDAQIVVSEPLGHLQGVWREVPESTCLAVRPGAWESRPFVPVQP